jgi:hypothetical protein
MARRRRHRVRRGSREWESEPAENRASCAPVVTMAPESALPSWRANRVAPVRPATLPRAAHRATAPVSWPGRSRCPTWGSCRSRELTPRFSRTTSRRPRPYRSRGPTSAPCRSRRPTSWPGRSRCPTTAGSGRSSCPRSALRQTTGRAGAIRRRLHRTVADQAGPAASPGTPYGRHWRVEKFWRHPPNRHNRPGPGGVVVFCPVSGVAREREE